ncbi:hypothetical protein FB387_005189 [Streptomyces cinereoruber]|nr:hypothetical protein [Streptomyces cinereoruber]NIH63978.1 hypothetical protein [Streptomyces cinereoruber]
MEKTQSLISKIRLSVSNLKHDRSNQLPAAFRMKLKPKTPYSTNGLHHPIRVPSVDSLGLSLEKPFNSRPSLAFDEFTSEPRLVNFQETEGTNGRPFDP